MALQGRETSSSPVSTCPGEKEAQCCPNNIVSCFFLVHEMTLFCPKHVVSFKRKGAKMHVLIFESVLNLRAFSIWVLDFEFLQSSP